METPIKMLLLMQTVNEKIFENNTDKYVCIRAEIH